MTSRAKPQSRICGSFIHFRYKNGTEFSKWHDTRSEWTLTRRYSDVTGPPTGQVVQDHVEHLWREPVEEAAARQTRPLAAGHHGPGHRGPGRTRPTSGPLVGLVCQRVLPNISGGSPHHDVHRRVDCVRQDKARWTRKLKWKSQANLALAKKTSQC